MKSNEFYSSLSQLPSTYSFNIQDNTIVGVGTKGTAKGLKFNPVTAVAYSQTGQVYSTNKRDTLRAGKAIGLTPEFTSHVYNATTSVSNRGNAQVVRGRIRSALGV
jgi:hypothetical protein